MKKKVIIISLILVALILSVALICFLLNIGENKTKKPSTTKTSPTKIEDVLDESEITSTTTEKVNNLNEVTTNNVTTTSTTPKKEITTTTTKQSIEKTSETTTTTGNNPWDKHGVTEDEYYNKPAHKWETVDFSIEKYGSESEARKACLAYGDNYEPYLTGKVTFNCDSVYSLSGRYLGEMFHTEKIN